MLRTIGVLMLFPAATPTEMAEPLRVGTFSVDASPPVGSPMAYDPTKEVETPLTCRRVVLVGKQQPIVLCAVNWIGIANDGHREFREALARAAGTTPQRVAVHSLHQHDAPWCDFSADALAGQYGIHRKVFDSPFAREVIRGTSAAVRKGVENARPVTLGEEMVEKVASNRRILGSDGKVQQVRWTATTDPAVREYPEGVVDPMMKSISFWDNDHAVVVLTYFATHPQSCYRTGKATADFPGLARNHRQKETGVLHIHFNGAGGNIGAGKYNDGARENRQVLADRMARGMAQAWDRTRKIPVSAADVKWKSLAVATLELGCGNHCHPRPSWKKTNFSTIFKTCRSCLQPRLAPTLPGWPKLTSPASPWVLAACCTCLESCSSNTNSPPNKCGPICL